jgi:peroxiredoxin
MEIRLHENAMFPGHMPESRYTMQPPAENNPQGDTMKTRWSIALILLAVLSASVAPAAEDSLFQDFDGQTRSVESFTGDGKWLVVMIWSHSCHVCNQEAEAYAQFHHEHEDTDARVLGISLDGIAAKREAEEFVARHDLSFPNLIGELATTMRYYSTLTGSRFRGTPTLLLFDPDGALRAAQAGAVPVSSIEAYIARNP